jgi:protein-L-isoaspartate(D-aspartate) O-methyltransferase
VHVCLDVPLLEGAETLMVALEAHRRFFARLVTAKANVSSTRVQEAFATVERERYAGPGPWKIFTPQGYIDTPNADPIFLYQDVLVGLSTDRAINNGEPSLHARCLAAADPNPGERVVHVGAGAGYYTAILATLVGAEGRVTAYEIEPDLAETAKLNLTGYSNIQVLAKSAIGTKLPDADIVYVNAGATHPPSEWLDALCLGGRLIMPLTAIDLRGFMLLITALGDQRFAAEVICSAGFIPCIGARDDVAARELARALARGDSSDVRSLRRGDAPDNSVWLTGVGWWLSTAAA